MELGDEVSYSHEGKTKNGVITGIKKGASNIENLKTGETWPTIRFRIKPKNGKRAFWTVGFADKKNEAPKKPLLV